MTASGVETLGCWLEDLSFCRDTGAYVEEFAEGSAAVFRTSGPISGSTCVEVIQGTHEKLDDWTRLTEPGTLVWWTSQTGDEIRRQPWS